MNVIESLHGGDVAHDNNDEEFGETDDDNFEIKQDTNNYTLRFSASYALG